MKILWLTWKDKKHPAAGGAETVNEELAKRLVADGHEVLFLVGGFAGAAPEESRDGFRIVRLGNRFTVYWQVYRYYKKNLSTSHFDYVIDEINTIPFFTKFYIEKPHPFPLLRKERGHIGDVQAGNNEGRPTVILFIHQLCREIWFHQMPFPFSLIGYLLEPLYLRLLNDQTVITVSESTKKDLMRFGFKQENIHIISEGIDLIPLQPCPSEASSEGGEEGGRELAPSERSSFSGVASLNMKFETPTILSLGACRAMKRTLHIVKAFEIAKQQQGNLRLIMAGDMGGRYGKKVLRYIESSRYRDSIDVRGRVSDQEKIELMQNAHILAVTSVKEGWGLVVTEANSQGTPAVVYDVDGLRDAVRHNETGLICTQNTPTCLAENIVKLLGTFTPSRKGKPGQVFSDYDQIRHSALAWSHELNFEQSYTDFLRVIRATK